MTDKVLEIERMTIDKAIEKFYEDRRSIEGLYSCGIINTREKNNFINALIATIRVQLNLPEEPCAFKERVLKQIDQMLGDGIKNGQVSVSVEREEPKFYDCYGKAISYYKTITIEIYNPKEVKFEVVK